MEKVLEQSIKQKNELLEGISYKVLGIINSQLLQDDLAIEYYKKALRIFSRIDNKSETLEIWWLLAESFKRIDDIIKSRQYLEFYITAVKEKMDLPKLVKAQHKLAELYLNEGKTSEALGIYQDILKIEEKRKNKEGIVVVQNKIGQVYLEKNDTKKAIRTYEQTAELAKESAGDEILISTLKNQGNAYRKAKNYKKELEVRQEILNIDRQNNDVNEQADDHLEIGNIYMEQDEEEKAIPYIEKSIELSSRSGDLEKKSIGLKTLSSAYDKAKLYDKALEVYKQYVETMDALHFKKEKDIRTDLELTATLNRKLQRLSMLEKDLEINEKTILLLQQEQEVNLEKLKTQKIFTYSLISGMLLLMLASFFLYRSSYQKRRANQLLAVKSLRSQMNPHFIYNSLNSVNSYISRNDPRMANKYLTDFSRLMRQVMENSKHDFIPLINEIDTIRLYLALEYSRFNDKFDYEIEISPNLNTSELEIPPMLIQPYIENAIWHGLRYKEEKGKLKVSFLEDNSSIQVLISDNGIGRKRSAELKTKNQKVHVSTGLKNIESRINIIKKLYKFPIEVSIRDLSGDNSTGTLVNISIPCRYLYENKPITS